MTHLFELANALALPFWLLMILAPGWRGTRRLMESALPITVLAIAYSVLVLPRAGALLGDLARPELSRVAALLGSAEGATIAWIHFLAFDLFVGRWIYLDSREKGLSPGWIAPILALTLMFGPLGYLAYTLVRRFRRSGGGLAIRAEAGEGGTGPGSRAPSVPGLQLSSALRRLWDVSPALVVTGVACLVLLVPAAAGVFLDPRIITGAPAWLKPAKFLASSAIYALTLAAFLVRVEGRQRWVRRVANGTALALGVELAIIGLQAARGTTSHFNTSTPFDSVLWGLMAGFIMLLWTLGFITAGMLGRQASTEPVFALSLRLAMFVALLGMGEGMLMARAGAHTVMGLDGGPGLPVVGWSTTGGDLRVAHFFGLHALQVIPLLGWLLSRSSRHRLRLLPRLRLVRLAAASYAGLIMLLTWQALRGEALMHPGGLTQGVSLALLLFAGVGAAIILRRPDPSPRSSENSGWTRPRGRQPQRGI